MIDWTALPDRVNNDAEFRLSARFWDATLRLDMGETSRALRFEDGALAEVRESDATTACDAFIRAPESDWRELLAPVPRPYYQDLFGASGHHDIELPEDLVAIAAYYPALRRLVQIMSQLREDSSP